MGHTQLLTVTQTLDQISAPDPLCRGNFACKDVESTRACWVSRYHWRSREHGLCQPTWPASSFMGSAACGSVEEHSGPKASTSPRACGMKPGLLVPWRQVQCWAPPVAFALGARVCGPYPPCPMIPMGTTGVVSTRHFQALLKFCTWLYLIT